MQVELQSNGRNEAESAAWVIGRSVDTLGLVAAVVLFAFGLVVPAVGLIGALGLVQGMGVFLWHGDGRITATGLYYYANAVFFGFASFFLALAVPHLVNWSTFVAGACVFACNSVIIPVSNIEIHTTPQQFDAAFQRFRREGWLLILFLSGVLASTFGVAVMGSHALASGGSPVAMLALSAFYAALTSLTVFVFSVLSKDVINNGLALGVWAGWLSAYTFTLWTGHGRMLIAVYLIGFIMVSTWSRPSVWVKMITVFATPVGVLAGAFHRAGSASEDVQLSDAFRVEGGIGSVVSPMIHFPIALFNDVENTINAHPRMWGKTLFDSFLAPIPRRWWPDKPSSLGFTSVEFLDPLNWHGGHGSHSIAVMHAGEFYINFGYPGFVIGALVVAFVLRALDRELAGCLNRGVHTAYDAFHNALIATLAGGMLDWVWAGSHTFMSRAGVRSILIGALLLAFSFTRARARQAATAQPQPTAQAVGSVVPAPRPTPALPPAAPPPPRLRPTPLPATVR